MSYIEDYLDQIPMWAAQKNSLENIRAWLEEMGNPDDAMRVIHVAGTNGKGSVCSYMTTVLDEAGFKVGTFISPHLVHPRERFLMYGEPVRQDTYENAFARVKRLSDRMTARGYQPPTYFEFLFYMSMAVNEQCRPDFVILETGLGGRLDVTNVIRHPLLTVLTSISMDHVQYLGNTIEEITAEKAGVLKPKVPVVYDASNPRSVPVIERQAERLSCPLFPVTQRDYTVMRRGEEGAWISVRTSDGGQLVLNVPSQAEYQLMNVAVAVKAMGVVRRYGFGWMSSADVVRGIRRSYWPGRMEELLPGVYLDGAHNIGGMEALHQTMERLQRETGKEISLLFSAANDKDFCQMINILCSGLVISHVTIARMDTVRSATVSRLAEEFQKLVSCPVKTYDTVPEAWRCFLKEKDDGLAFCTGSLYLVGEVKTLLKEKAYDRF